jgi:hypothetical protein
MWIDRAERPELPVGEQRPDDEGGDGKMRPSLTSASVSAPFTKPCSGAFAAKTTATAAANPAASSGSAMAKAPSIGAIKRPISVVSP